jgi:hypothetical protein
MDSVLTKILEREGPCLSGDVVRILVSTHGMSATAARQRIARRPDDIKALRNLPFPRNAQFLYLKDEYGSPEFWRALVKALKSSSPSYAGALGALSVRGGIMPKQHFLIACGAPLKLTRHMSPETIVQGLVGVGLLEEREVDGVGPCIAFAKRSAAYFEQPIADMKARLIVEGIMLNAVKQWARNLAIGSYDRFETRDAGSLPQVGMFAWDLAAPSYLSGLRGAMSNGGPPKPGFIVCDILLGHLQTDSGLLPFIRKCKTVRSLRNVGRCLYIFVAERYADSAFKTARSSGIIPATPQSLFGEELAAAFIELAKVLKQAATVAVDPEKFDWLFNQLGKIEGAALSLRGALFEFVVADVVRKLWGAQVTLNYKFRDAGQEIAEVDVLAVVTGRMIHFIECKGQAPHQTLDDEEVKKWLTERVPTVRRKALEHPDWKNLDMHFELWTSGGLSADATERIAKARSSISPRKYTVLHRSGAEIGALAASLNDEPLKRVLQTHFLEHPLSSAEFQGTALSAPTITLPSAAAAAALEFEDLTIPRLPKAG